MTIRRMIPLILAGGVSACVGATVPPEQLLADQCQILTDAYNNAAGEARANKLSEAQIHTLVALEPISYAYCNPDSPPTDVRTALQNVHDAVGQLSVMTPTASGGK